MAVLQPQSVLRRSFLYREHLKLGAQFVDHCGQMVVAHYAQTDRSASHDQLCQLAMCDFSTINRTGFKGFNTPMWLGVNHVEIPTKPNQARTHSDHTLIARLSRDEHLLLSNPIANIDRFGSASQRNESLTNSEQIEIDLIGRLSDQYDEKVDGVYDLPRAESHAWLYVSGQRAPEMMSHLCAVDLRPKNFNALEIAQTSVARTNAIIIRQDLNCAIGFHLLCDSATVEYLWSMLAATCHLYSGKPVGFEAFIGQVFTAEPAP